MKLWTLILLFFSLSCKSQAEAHIKEPYDTTKFVLNKIDIKPAIVHELFNCFVNNKFKPLTMYCRGSMEFQIKQTEKLTGKSIYTTEIVTEYGATQKLNDIFQSISYARFKILSGKNNLSEVVLVVKVFLYEDKDDPVIDVYFVLDSHDAIKTIAIL